MTQAAALHLDGISKSFYGVSVLHDVSLDVGRGEVLGLVGENGAGKSTLMNIVGGVLAADCGRIRLFGSDYAPRTPGAARNAGVSFIHQELNLFPNLTVADNICLGSLPVRRRGGIPWLDRRLQHRRAEAALAKVGLDVSPHNPVARLSPGERQLVEIARELSGEARIVIFDEPTTSLSHRECEHLFGLIRRLKDSGIAIVYISHNLTDVLGLADRVVVLRDGRVVGEALAREWRIDELIQQMVGRKLEKHFPPRTSRPQPETLLEVRGLSSPGTLANVSFDLHSGEILGFAGMLGAGRTELARALFGLDSGARGSVRLGGRPLRRSPRARIDRGLAFVTEDRREEGLLPEANVVENLGLVALPEHARGPIGFLDRESLRDAVRSAAGTIGLHAADPERTATRTLSGGNQQKVVFGKWLLRRPSVLILDEPTRGIDVGAKHELYRVVDRVAARGAAILFISSELEELVGLCDRILVMRAGEIVAAFERPGFDREEILRAAL